MKKLILFAGLFLFECRDTNSAEFLYGKWRETKSEIGIWAYSPVEEKIYPNDEDEFILPANTETKIPTDIARHYDEYLTLSFALDLYGDGTHELVITDKWRDSTEVYYEEGTWEWMGDSVVVYYTEGSFTMLVKDDALYMKSNVPHKPEYWYDVHVFLLSMYFGFLHKETTIELKTEHWLRKVDFSSIYY